MSCFGYLFSFTLNDLIFVCHWPVFHGPVILLRICNSIKYEGIILWILVQSDTVKDLVLFAGQYDLYYFIVQ